MYRLITIIALLFPLQLLAEDKVIHIYQDADISNHLESSDAIQKGIEVAFDEIGSEIDGYKIVYKYVQWPHPIGEPAYYILNRALNF